MMLRKSGHVMLNLSYVENHGFVITGPGVNTCETLGEIEAQVQLKFQFLPNNLHQAHENKKINIVLSFS